MFILSKVVFYVFCSYAAFIAGKEIMIGFLKHESLKAYRNKDIAKSDKLDSEIAKLYNIKPIKNSVKTLGTYAKSITNTLFGKSADSAKTKT